MNPDSLDVLPEELRATLGLFHPPDLRANGDPPNPPRADSVPPERLVRRALEQADSGRNEAGFSLALQLRDNGYSQSEAEAIVGEYASRVPPTNTKGETEPYTRREALASVKQAYRQPPREPWPGQKPSQTAEDAEMARLAALDLVLYDQQRKAAAEKLGIRVSTLDTEVERFKGKSAGDAQSGVAFDLADPELWPTPVDGAALLDKLAQTINKYVSLPRFAAETVALWTIHAHAHDTSFISPILATTSPVLGCGKTTLLMLLSALTPRALPVSNLTAASLFRAVEKWRPTLLIDEADTYLKENQELRGLLNSGHNKGASWILRCVGEDHEPRKFSTWCGKAIALIGKLPATLASRSIHIEMRRLGPGEQVAMLRADRLGQVEPLRQMAWRWTCDNDEALRNADPRMPASLRGRAADNWRPLLAVADLAGGEWPAKARQAAAALETGDDAEGLGILLLRDLRELFDECETDRLPSEDIVKALTGMEDRPWPEYRRGKPITQRQLATLLKGFGIEPRTLRLDDGRRCKGYLGEDFADAFSRYTPDRSVTPCQSTNNRCLSGSPSVTGDGDVTDRKHEKANNDRVCHGVTDRDPQPSGRKEVLEL